MISDVIQAVTDSTFEADVIQSSLPVLIDFWAAWCGPCKALTPIFEEVAQQYVNKVKFLKMDVDQSHEIPAKFAVRGIPTLLLFKDGQVATTHVGLLNKTQLVQLIDDHI